MAGNLMDFSICSLSAFGDGIDINAIVMVISGAEHGICRCSGEFLKWPKLL